MANTEQPVIAFLGTGLMGAPMVRNLLKAGFQVCAWNRTFSKAEALVSDGASVAPSPAEAVAGADICIMMLESGAISTRVLFESGVADALKPGSTVIDMASIPPSVAKDHAEALTRKGINHVDAPVSGGTPGAEAATLAIMAGGEGPVIEAARSVFEAMGRITRVGPHGAGQLAKLANQVIVGVTIGAVSEALFLAEAGGADPAAVREALRGGFAESRVLEVHGERMVTRNFVPGGPCAIHLKDMATVLDTAKDLSINLPLSAQVHNEYKEIVEKMAGERFDHSALLLWLESKHTGVRVGNAPDQLPT